jgi:alkaline phosphatase D
VVTPATDLTVHLPVHGLPAGRHVFYRLRFEDLSDPTLQSEPLAGHFRTAPSRRQDVSFVWSGDTAGQGWGINPDFGGMRIYETIRRTEPDFFLHSGDNIYADGEILPSVTLPDGSVWRNLTTEAKSKVAETLDEFRGNYRYNLLDENFRALYAEVPVLAQWDDHETRNNWFPGQTLDDPRYTERRVDVLSARSRPASSSTCRSSSGAATPKAASTGRCAAGRCWTCSCSTSGPTAARTRPTTRRPRAPPPRSWVSASSPGSSGSCPPRGRPGS